MRLHQTLALLLCLSLFIPLSTAAQVPPPTPPMPSEYASVGISPSYQEVALGTQVSFTVSAQSTLGGTVSISVPSGLELVDSPSCSGPCRGPFVSSTSGTNLIEVTLDGESAVVGFTVSVSTLSQVGDTINISVTLVGGPQAVEMASATVYVTEPIPTQESVPAEDNRSIFLEANPQFLRIAPGGNALFHTQPARWGMWTGPGPDITVDINVPPGLTPTSDPFCGRGDVRPAQNPCGVSPTEEQDGSTTYAISPGYSTADQSINGIYLVLRADSELEAETTLQVKVSAVVDDDTLAQQPDPVTSTVQIVATESLLVTQETAGSTGAIIELSQGFSTSGSTCSTAALDSQFGLYEFGLETKLSSGTLGTGQVESATDGSGREVCHVPVLFSDVPPRDMYILATSYGDEPPCRACVYGFITTTDNAEIVFVDR